MTWQSATLETITLKKWDKKEYPNTICPYTYFTDETHQLVSRKSFIDPLFTHGVITYVSIYFTYQNCCEWNIPFKVPDN